MATSVMTGEGGPSTADSAEGSSLARRALLACGILAPVVYAAADVLGGKPGFGIVERVVIYASLLWVAVLAAALLRRPRLRGVATTRVTATTHFEGFVDTEDHRRRQGR